MKVKNWIVCIQNRKILKEILVVKIKILQQMKSECLIKTNNIIQWYEQTITIILSLFSVRRIPIATADHRSREVHPCMYCCIVLIAAQCTAIFRPF